MTGERAYFGITICFGVALSVVAWMLLSSLKLRVRNFRGVEITSGYGIYFLAWTMAGAAGCLALPAIPKSVVLPCSLCITTFGLLGLLDDRLGRHGGGGFRGHLRRLVREGKVSTGLVKAAGGAIAAVTAVLLLGPKAPLVIILDAAIIALAANFINLLDMRPGRAVWIFSALWMAVALQSGLFIPITGPVFAAAVVCGFADSRAKWMMGDTGSNLLGACLGLGVVLTFNPVVRVSVLATLVLLHIYAEMRSLSRDIESVRLLRCLDRLLGVR